MKRCMKNTKIYAYLDLKKKQKKEVINLPYTVASVMLCNSVDLIFFEKLFRLCINLC